MTYYPTLGQQIEAEMRAKELTTRFLGRRLYEHLGFRSPEAAEYYISWVRKGSIYGATSARAARKQQNVDRLAIFLYALGFAEDHQVIRAIRQADARFAYPPAQGVPYEALVRDKSSPKGLEYRIPNA